MSASLRQKPTNFGLKIKKEQEACQQIWLQILHLFSRAWSCPNQYLRLIFNVIESDTMKQITLKIV